MILSERIQQYVQRLPTSFQAEVLRWFLLVTYVYQLVREGFKWLVGHKRPLREERVRAYSQVLRSGLHTSASPLGEPLP